MAKLTLSPFETMLLQDAEVMISKQELIKKLLRHFEELGNIHSPGNFKITKGERHHELPFIVLDMPPIKAKDNYECIRLMFWWGKYFLFSKIIQGEELLVKKFGKQKLLFNKGDIYMLKGKDPWLNDLDHASFKNEFSFNDLEIQFREHGFVRISKKLALDQFMELEDQTLQFMNLFR